MPYNPWKSYGDFQCFDVEFLHRKTIKYNSEHKSPSGRVYDIARSIGTGHQNSAKTRELALNHVPRSFSTMNFQAESKASGDEFEEIVERDLLSKDYTIVSTNTKLWYWCECGLHC